MAKKRKAVKKAQKPARRFVEIPKGSARVYGRSGLNIMPMTKAELKRVIHVDAIPCELNPVEL